MPTLNCRKWIGRAALAAVLACLLLPAVHADDLLDPEDAFKFSAVIHDDGRGVQAHFSIADGYYLYRERFGFAASDGVKLGVPQYPPGKIKFDETFNKELEIYRGNVIVNLPVQSGSGAFVHGS
jgi:thiol:disulfide interchange protein DsbD